MFSNPFFLIVIVRKTNDEYLSTQDYTKADFPSDIFFSDL